MTHEQGRRRRLGPEQRRRQLIDATVSVVSSRGYQNASLGAIAREAGVSKGLLWHYFADGDDLMEQTARATLVALREVVARDVDLSAEVPQVIRSAIRRAAALRDTHGPQLRALREIVGNLRWPDGTQRLGLHDYEETYALQAKLFRRGQDEGSLRGFDTRYMAVTYQGAVDTMLAYLDSHPGTDVDEYASAVADILLTGIAASRPLPPHWPIDVSRKWPWRAVLLGHSVRRRQEGYTWQPTRREYWTRPMSDCIRPALSTRAGSPTTDRWPPRRWPVTATART